MSTSMNNMFKELDNELYQLNTEVIFIPVLTGTLSGRKFVIGAHHVGHPNAYVELSDEDVIRDGFDLMNVHGGGSYFGKAYWDDSDTSTYVGWDYAHCDDFMLVPEEFTVFPYLCSGHKWTVCEILRDVFAAIEELDNRIMEDEDI